MSARIYDRAKGTWYEERQFMQRELEWLYGSALGRFVLNAVVSRRWFSALYAHRYKNAASLSMIEPFISAYGIQIDEYQQHEYANFNEFFTRNFAPGVRAFDKADKALISPCDGKLSVVSITTDMSLDIKQARYSLQELCGEHADLSQFSGGTCMVFRLSVEDGHRYIYIDDGCLDESWMIGGRLYTVGSKYAAACRVYAKNQRICQMLSTRNFAQVLWIDVGALLVGRIINHPLQEFKKGQEKGYFEYGGSSIVLLFAADIVDVAADIMQICADGSEVKVRRGETIGTRKSA